MTAGVSVLVLCCMALGEEETVCASVSMEVEQDATLERQAFDAYLKINNGYSNVRLEDVRVEVSFTDAANAPVEVTDDQANTNALFYVRVSDMDAIDDVDGYGSVEPDTSAEIHWLIVPSQGAAENDPQGTKYNVGGLLRYTLGGEENQMELLPDQIRVRPMPDIVVDYFIQKEVIGDDAMTADVTEESVPFPLALRVANEGVGTAPNVRMVSAQPRIRENEQGLLIGFRILETEINGISTSDRSLQFDFGDLASGEAAVAITMMECSLAGTFTEFDAQFTHADELGGELTSLISEMNAHSLLHAVLVDLAGRDGIRDFLAQENEGAPVWLYESDYGLDRAITNYSDAATLTFSHMQDVNEVYTFTVPHSVGALYASVSFTNAPNRAIQSVVRQSDGTVLPVHNAWFSQTRESGLEAWVHSFNLFDAYGGGEYQVFMAPKADAGNRRPILHYVGPQTGHPGKTLSFLVTASDPDGTIPTLSVSNKPMSATFNPQTNGTSYATALFAWTPSDAEQGDQLVYFHASDGMTSDTIAVSISITGENPNYPDWWYSEGVVDTNAVSVNDFAAANLGQVRHIATKAWSVLDDLPGGAGFSLSFTNANNYAVVNVGQLKALATNFYDRLGMGYPWVASSNDANDRAIANIGQVKYVFSFDPTLDTDGDAMPDWWEAQYTGAPAFLDASDPSDANEDPDLDGRPNWSEYDEAKDPTVAD